MLQVKTFLVPTQEAEANEFLQTHKPVGTVSFNKDIIVVFYDTYETTPEIEISELKELYRANRDAKFQQEIGLFVMKRELADTPTNLARYDELAAAIKQMEANLGLQDAKAGYVQERIAALGN